MVAGSLQKTLVSLARNGAAQKLATRSNSHLSYQQVLAYAPATQLTTLDNKMRVASEDNGRPTTTVGLYLELGSRDEKLENCGIGGIFTQLASEGTTKRTGSDVRKQLRDLGAKLEVNRGRELTSLTATVANENVASVVEILADIVQNSKFDAAAIEKQKAVMLANLEAAEANNIEAVSMDFLHSVAFQGTPLALSPMGNTQGIRSVTAADLADYRSNLVVGERMMLAVAGGVPHSQVAELAAKHFTDCDGSKAFAHSRDYCRFTSSGVRVRDDEMPRAHVAYAFLSPPSGSQDHLTLELARILLGSWDTTMSGFHTGDMLRARMTHLNKAFMYKTFNLGYSDTGLFGFYTNCTRANLVAATEMVGETLRDLSGYVTDADLERGKHLLRLELHKALEHNPGAVSDIATQMIYTGRRLTPLQLEEAINAITVSSLTKTVEKYTLKMPIACSGMGPVEGMLTVDMYHSVINFTSIL